ncbi:hypothetical protein S40288_11799 [Stachybotrys chartarum IBT 40288]|nr:hypothetical protein S40288_11799 [Stachybotrys chartarum IBT 40288]
MSFLIISSHRQTSSKPLESSASGLQGPAERKGAVALGPDPNLAYS